MSNNEFINVLQSLKHRTNDIRMAGANDQTKIYNNKKAYIQWSDLVAPKDIKHLNLR